jgi:hypothetical protein
MLREHFAPGLREHGFKGTSRQFKKKVDDYVLGMSFQKSRHSTREIVDYGIHVTVDHPESKRAFELANEEADRLGKARQDPIAGNWHVFFPNVLARGEVWLQFRAGEDPGAHAQRLLVRLRSQVFPLIAVELERPLEIPTIPSERIDYEKDQALSEGRLWSDRLRTMSQAGLRVVPNTSTWEP